MRAGPTSDACGRARRPEARSGPLSRNDEFPGSSCWADIQRWRSGVGNICLLFCEQIRSLFRRLAAECVSGACPLLRLASRGNLRKMWRLSGLAAAWGSAALSGFAAEWVSRRENPSRNCRFRRLSGPKRSRARPSFRRFARLNWPARSSARPSCQVFESEKCGAPASVSSYGRPLLLRPAAVARQRSAGLNANGH